MAKPKNTQKIGKKNRQYSPRKLKDAVRKVLLEKCSIFKASKEFKVPWTTLKENVVRAQENETEENNFQFSSKKVGRPFSLNISVEQQLVKYITDMQSLGCGLTVTKIRQTAFRLAEASKQKHHFNINKSAAGWN